MTMDNNIPLPGKTKRSVPDSIKRAAQEYKEAYAKVYGITPTLTYQPPWVRIQGQTAGVKLKRLKEMTTQLKRRMPDDEPGDSAEDKG